MLSVTSRTTPEYLVGLRKERTNQWLRSADRPYRQHRLTPARRDLLARDASRFEPDSALLKGGSLTWRVAQER